MKPELKLDGAERAGFEGSADRPNLTRIADDGAWHRNRKIVLLLCLLATVIDGFDNQILGLSVPAMAIEWHAAPSQFVIVMISGMAGMIVGTTGGGLLGDRLGRKLALLASMAIFGIMTGLTAKADGLGELALLRFLAGCGLGGAVPTATALVSEFTPRRNRTLAVTIVITSFPIGAFMGGWVASLVLPNSGWRSLFLIGAVITMMAMVLLALLLPESPAFLFRKGISGRRFAQSLRAMGNTGGMAAADLTMDPPHVEKATIGSLLLPGLRRDTIAIWSAFFGTLLAMYTVMNWLPAMLAGEGFHDEVTSRSIALYSIGGVFGALAIAVLVTRGGSRWSILGTAGGGVFAAFVLALLPSAQLGPAVVLTAAFVLGWFVIGSQTALYSLAASIYPADIRATGIGTALGVGRIGALASAYGGAWATARGHGAFFALIVVALVIALVGIAAVRSHTPAIRRST